MVLGIYVRPLGASGTLDSNSIICSISISSFYVFLYKAFCCLKTEKVEMDCNLKLVGGEVDFKVMQTRYIKHNRWY